MAEPVTIVSGLPRSGTSMMMRMLEAGGMGVVVDHLREADEDNPRGYYEFEKVKMIKKDHTWLREARNKVVKMVSMLLYELPSDQNYKVIFMMRDLSEMLTSQQVMLERAGDQGSTGKEEMKVLYSAHLNEIRNWLAQQKNMEVLYVNYRDVVENPRTSAETINIFLGNRLSVDKMIGIVDKALYRQRSCKSEVLESETESSDTVVKEEDKEKIESQLRSLGYM